MATFLHRLGSASYRNRGAVVFAWLVLLIGLGFGATALAGKTVTTFSIPGQESTTALERMRAEFGSGPSGASAQVVVRAPEGARITDQLVAGEVTRLVGALNGLPGVTSATNPLNPAAPVVSADQAVAYSTVTYDVQAPDITDEQRQALLDAVAGARQGGLAVEVTGEATREVVGIGGPAEVIGVAVALLVLALTYGSLVTAGMNMLTAVVGVGIGALGITLLTGFVELQSTTPILAVMLGLAVGIDYALFIVTRFRHELIDGRDVPSAIAMAVGTAGSAVVTAGITVVIALTGLAVAGIPFLTEMGVAAAATVVVAVLIAVTLVPAALGFIGRRALPRRLRAGARPVDRGVYRRWASATTKNRWPVLVVAVAALAVVAIPAFSMQTSLAQRPAEGSTQARAVEIVSEHFGPGFTGPLLVLVEGDEVARHALEVSSRAKELGDVAAVGQAQVNSDGTAALVNVVPASAPDSAETIALVDELRSAVSGVDGATVYVTGTTAVGVDVSHRLDESLPTYLVLVVGLALVLLVLVFRSLPVPVAGVLGFLLTVGASLGATTAVFQWGWLKDVVRAETTGPLMSLAPMMVTGILFGLAMDYQVFLVSRMHEAHAHGAEPREAVVTGFRQAAPVVVAAAAIMFAVFAGFVPEGEATIKPIAFALAIGILVDAVVVRMVAIPAALAIMGSAAWWLPRSLRWLPVLDVEGAALERGGASAVPQQDRTEPVGGVGAGAARGEDAGHDVPSR
ncbi:MULTISPECIES: MMPL family transporter [Actinosynnema]|uniref:MMPL family transporter n=1 Tax=Actinosynnema TaxID=40566 RepID=UPI0020A39FB3|nr:MMPL family transporter [Actinosynnema pretiosum]MCP2098728.1 putative drug exporter of the RND superfamily [Actinosynnema pretiosum]